MRLWPTRYRKATGCSIARIRSQFAHAYVVRQESSEITEMRMAGAFDKPTARAINSVIEARSRTAPCVVPPAPLAHP